MDNQEELSKVKKNFLKSKIKNILLYKGQESKGEFLEIINENLNDNDNIKYIIKIISYYSKNSINNEMRINCFDFFIELIKNISNNNIIICLTNILVFMQENISILKINIIFEIMMGKLSHIEIKTFEILNGFCLLNIKKNSNIIKKEALLCYQSLIKNFNNLIPDNFKVRIIKSFLDTITQILLNKKNIFEDKYLLLLIINDIICLSKENSNLYIESILSSIIQDLSLNDDNIKIIILDIINNIIKFIPSKKNEIRNIIFPYLNRINDNNLTNNIIKRIVYNIKTILDLNKTVNQEIPKTKKSNKNQRNDRKLKEKINNNYKNGNKSFGSENCSNRKKNIKCEIFVNKRYFPINKLNANNSFKLDKTKIGTFRKEEDFVNPIQLWYDFDTDITNKNMKKERILSSINLKESINNNQINIINQKNGEPKLDLIMDEIIKLSNNQNIIAEKIINLDRNTQKQISYFEDRLYQLENKDINNDLNNKRYRILFPINDTNKKLIDFLITKNDDMSIYHLKSINDYEMELIDNNLIDEIVDKLIYFFEHNVHIEESMTFIKKLFVKNKKRFNFEQIKKLLASFDVLLSSNSKLSDQISFDISLIISSINAEKI
jgi:hypothetical protein